MTTWSRGRVNLVWSAAHELHGLQVVMRRRPFGELLDEWAAEEDGGTVGPAEWDALPAKERAERTRANTGRLAALIMSWNLADDLGEPVPWPPRDATGEPIAWPPADQAGLDAGAAVLLQHCDASMIADMRTAYNEATNRVAPPLSPSSGDGPEDWSPADLPAQEAIAPA